MWYLAVLVLFSIAQIAIGLIIARRVKVARDFFVAGRQLGPGLLFSTFLAANIGGGSSVGAAGYGYRDGLSAWWWVGSAGIGSIVLALWIGPRMRQLSAAHDLRTVGDFLEWRYDRRVRATISVILWFGALALLAGQLVAMSKLVRTVAGWEGWIGCVVGGVVMTIYSAAGGLKSTAWVNIIQLVVKLLGFFIALPIVLGIVHGISGLQAASPGGDYWSFWQNGDMGWVLLLTLGPSFFVSPGLIQKTFGARDDRTVRLAVGLNAIALLIYAAMPVLLGMSAQALHPGLQGADRELALPLLLVHDLPPAVGMLAMAALFSAEVSAADAALFMLTTSLSQDVYRRFLNPAASDSRVLAVARWTTLVAGALSVALAIMLPSVGDVLLVFYTLLAVSLFVPITAGLALPRVGARDALAAIVVGVTLVIAMRFGNGGKAVLGLTPSMWGLLGAMTAAAATMLVGGSSGSARAGVKEQARNE
jgi:SSS family solute:Na+ symporter